MEFNKDFSDMLLALNDAEVPYLVVGAYAVAVHGFPRATGDLDIWVRADAATAPRVMKALRAFGAPVHEVTEADFAHPSVVFQIGVPPGRIDILTVVSGLDFDGAWENRVMVTIENVVFPVIARADLLINKRAAGRPKDLADLHGLEASKGGSIEGGH
jgi:hypothetical protein